MLNNNYIYNEKYIVIVPNMSVDYLEGIKFSFGNTILFDNSKDTNYIINFINKSNFNQVIFIDYQLEYHDIIKGIKGNHDIKIIFTGAMGAFSNSFTYSIFKGILDMYEKYDIDKIGFLDKNLYKVMKEKKYKCTNVILDVPVLPINDDFNGNEIGILNNQENPRHSFYNSLSALKFKNYVASIFNVSKETKRFLKLFDIKYKKVKDEDGLFKRNLVNLYINFTDNNNLVFIKSMDYKVPCILGNNELLKDDELLNSMLTVKSDDNVNEIAEKIEIVKKNRRQIFKEYKTFRKNYSKLSKDSVNEFLGLKSKKENVKKQESELLLSIIVPVYNTSEYLKASLTSIIKAIPNEIKKKTEILVINDGSSDDSEEIIIKYKKKYPNLINYIKQKNHGLGNVRNVGLKLAKGKYIASIDSDDTINAKFFKEFINAAKDDVDVIMCDWLSITNDVKFETSAIEWIFKDINMYEGILYTTIMPSSCNKIIKKSLYDELKIKFIEDKYEDLSTNPFIMLVAKTIKYINKPYYEYYIRSNSIMRSSAGYSMIDVIKKVDERLNKYINYVNVDIDKFKFYTYSWRIEEFILNQLYDINDYELKDFIGYVYDNLYDVIVGVFKNNYYLNMLNNISSSKSKYIMERNKAFTDKKLFKFISSMRKSKQYYRLNAPIIYFGENINNK